VLRIRDVLSRIRIRPLLHPGSRIRGVKKHRIPDLTSFFTQAINKFCLLIPDPTIAPSRIRIPDPGGKKAPHPGSGSATLVLIVDVFQWNVIVCVTGIWKSSLLLTVAVEWQSHGTACRGKLRRPAMPVSSRTGTETTWKTGSFETRQGQPQTYVETSYTSLDILTRGLPGPPRIISQVLQVSISLYNMITR
jgi:hypothetical protein